MNSKQFNKFYDNSAFKGEEVVRESVIKTIVQGIPNSVPDEASGTELSIAFAIVIAITIKSIGIEGIKQIECYMELLKSDVSMFSFLINKHE